MARTQLWVGAVLSLFAVHAARAAEWPMFRGNAGRTGYTAEALGAELTLLWAYHAPHKPAPAWPTRHREQFDRAYQTAISNGVLYFGSSASGKLYALDAATGQLRWEFFTGGPIRFAPAVRRDRVLLASDDGCLYCLRADDGGLLWKLRAGPSDDMVLGNQHLISRWPARGGPVVYQLPVSWST